jgi:hypothetical protein
MQVIQTDGLPPSRGTIIFATIGSTRKSRTAETSVALVKTASIEHLRLHGKRRVYDGGRSAPFPRRRRSPTVPGLVLQSPPESLLSQRFARHVPPLTAVVDTRPSDDEMHGKVRGLAC